MPDPRFTHPKKAPLDKLLKSSTEPHWWVFPGVLLSNHGRFFVPGANKFLPG